MLREQQEKVIRTVKIGDDNITPWMITAMSLSWMQLMMRLKRMTFGVMRKIYTFPIFLKNWSNSPVDVVPGQPEPWVDMLADEVEIQRLLGMGILQKSCDFKGEISGTLTTRFVYDWRLKTYDGDNSLWKGETKRWMRRSRYVAREFANDKADDVYSPATGCHTSNLVPIVFLQMLKQLELSELDKENYDVVLAALDIKDASLQVPQQHVVSVNLHGTEYVVLRNLPGQRLGAKAWYWYFREYVTSSMNFEWCSVQPCLVNM